MRPMREVRHVATGCEGKIAYHDEQTAHAAAAGLREKRRRRGAGMVRAYKCKVCGRWHIGNSSKRRMKHG